MIQIADPFDLPATPASLRHQAQQGVLDKAALRRSFKLTGHTPSALMWGKFLDRLLLVLGAGLLVSGIIFFFAFNWAGMHRFIKLGMLEFGVVAATGLAFWLGLRELAGKISLTVAAFLIGALLAVYGQIYQTGADSYELFLAWAGLILGWVVISRFTPLWITWLLLVNLTLCLYAAQILGEIDGRLYAVLFLLNAGALGSWEWASRHGVTWLQSRWTPRLLAMLMLGPLIIATLMLIFDSPPADPLLSWLTGSFMIASTGLLYLYSEVYFDAFMLILTALGICICSNSLLLKVVKFEAAGVIMLGILVILQTGGVVAWIRNRALQWEVRTP